MTLTAKVCTLPTQGNCHQHPQHQLILGVQGMADFEIQGRGARVSALRGCIAPAEVSHAYQGLPDNHVVVVDLLPGMAQQLSPHPAYERLFEQPTYFDIDRPLRQLLYFSAQEMNRFGTDPLLQQHISSTLIYSIHQRLFDTPKPEPARQGIDLPKLDQFILDNLAGKITVQHLAAQAHLSSSHFHALFKQATGLSPHQYVLQLRLEHARSLLENTDLSLVDIAQQSGFSSQSALCHSLKQHQGDTPSRIRRQARSAGA